MRRTGICGATETLLVNSQIASEFLPSMYDKLNTQGCEVLGDKFVQSIIPDINLATDEDWSTEYLSPKISIKIVKDIYEAIEHIDKFGTDHTDAIITKNIKSAKKFLKEVKSSISMHNASTQFADGGEFGFGGEVGISTNKLPTRGPVGVNQLVSYNYQISSY